jgi:redox-sensitive bicupin YhaK (pirin superfamily)
VGHHIELEKGEQINVQFMVHAPTCSRFTAPSMPSHRNSKSRLTCGDGAFIRDEANITLVADTPLRALLIDLPV